MTTLAAVQFSGVSKAYRKNPALRDLTLTIPAGSVVGLLGRNGAGKSTALRCLVGLDDTDAGQVTVLGHHPLKLDIATRQRLTFLPEQGVPFPTATVAALIELCAPLYPDWNRPMEDEVLGRFDIDPRRRLRELSLGQQRAVGLVLAVCPQPALLVLDEPAANLDPVARREFMEIILGLVGRGEGDRTVIFSSHVLTDVERVADRVAILHKGQLLLHSALDDLKDEVRRVRLVFDQSPPANLIIPGSVAVRQMGREVLATFRHFDDGLAEQLAGTAGVSGIDAQRIGLEEFFLDLVGDHRTPEGLAA
ncbi:MAG: type transport system ATP-binding protein [Myxococcales bacterium]|jgi:ABC-2 type transport system ATP-binding protein|nr:type transport system ATP-binding protein [Myxococcales bacterium]